MEQLMEQYAAPHQAPAEGEIESGQVVAVTDLGVVVNLGGKTEGLIPAQEFAELDGPFPLQPGQPVEVQRTGDRKDGYVLLSYQRVPAGAPGARSKKPTATRPKSPEKSWTTSRRACGGHWRTRVFAGIAGGHAILSVTLWSGRIANSLSAC